MSTWCFNDLLELQIATSETRCMNLPQRIELINRNENMKCRKVKTVLRYHTPNKRKEPEAYFYHLMMLYYTWRDEDNLLAEDGTYVSTFLEPGV